MLLFCVDLRIFLLVSDNDCHHTLTYTCTSLFYLLYIVVPLLVQLAGCMAAIVLFSYCWLLFVFVLFLVVINLDIRTTTTTNIPFSHIMLAIFLGERFTNTQTNMKLCCFHSWVLVVSSSYTQSIHKECILWLFEITLFMSNDAKNFQDYFDSIDLKNFKF